MYDINEITTTSKIDGYAAAAGERDKERTYVGHFSAARFRLVPLVHETFGRMGRQGAVLVEKLAEHSAKRRGGSVDRIKYSKPVIEASIRGELSAHLAASLAQRLGAYVRGAVQHHGRQVTAVSSLLESSGSVMLCDLY